MANFHRTLYDSTLFHPYFDRQMRIPDWNQDLLSQQVALVLGIGGLGSTVSIDLLRLGVKKIICVDYDTVDSHNLNRQLLYNKEHVDKKKAEIAKEELEKQNLTTEIECYDLDACKNWNKIVEFAKQSTVVFNMIDVGDYWDYAVQSLCLALNLTFVSGGTFQTTVTVDYVHKKNIGACWSCLSDVKKEYLEHMTIDNILKLNDLNFIPREEHPIGASACYVAAICAHLMVNRWVTALFLSDEEIVKLPNRIMFYLNTLEIDKWTVERSADCPLCTQLTTTTTTTQTNTQN
jgi:molybdopterin/thiamine biosynthesis adenylyltransferase